MTKSAYTTRTVLLDAHAIIHRAYHAMPDFATRDGKPTGGLYGVCTMLLKIIDELKPDYVIACYDLPKPTFRHVAYDNYKGGRKESDDDLKEQLQTSREIFEAFSIPIYELEGYEADDILGTIAEQLKPDLSHEIIIASGDMDTMQLIDADQVQVYTLKKGITNTILYDENAVVERYGFGSDLIADYKGLAGDSSDNIKGVKGIGAKTATNLIQQFGTVEQIYSALHKDEQLLLDAGVTKRMVGLLAESEEDALFSKELATIKCDVPITYTIPDHKFHDGINLADAGDLFRKLEFRTMLVKLKSTLGIKEDKVQDSLFADESDIDAVDLAQAKLAVWLLNPVISEPSLDDVLRYGDDFETAFKELQKDITEQELDFVWKEIECAGIDAVNTMNGNGFNIDQKQLEKLSKQFHKKIEVLEKSIYAHAGEEFNIKSTQQLSRILFEVMELPTKGIKKTPKGVLSTKESELEKLQSQHAIINDILSYRELTKLTSTYLDNIKPMIDQTTGRLYATFVPTGTTTGRMSSRDPNLQNIPVSGQYGKMIRTIFVPSDGYTLVACDYSQIELRMAAELSGDETFINAFINGEDIHAKVAEELFGNADGENRRKAKVINFGILYGMGANALRNNLGTDEHSLDEARNYLEQYFIQFPTLAAYLESTKEFAREFGFTKTLFGRRRHFKDINSKIPFLRASAERMAINAPIQGTATADIIKLALRDVHQYINDNSLQSEIKTLAQVHDELVFEIQDANVSKHSAEIKKIMESVLKKYAKQISVQTQVPLVVEVNTGANWAETK